MRIFIYYLVFILSAMGTILAKNEDDHQAFNERMLELHNTQRDLHNARPLTLDTELSIDAMKIAEHWVLTNENSHKEDLSYGCNFFSIRTFSSVESVKLSPYSVFERWYHTPTRYNYNQEPPKGKFDAFTQIVWKGTTKLGVAKLEIVGNSVVVTTYSPVGNIKGQYINNVEEKKK